MDSLLLPTLLLSIQDNPSHGYELIEKLEGFGGAQRDPSIIYRSLRQMEEWGLVASSWDTEGPGPPRRVYHITEEGKAALNSWVEGIKELKRELERFLAAHEPSKGGRNR